MAEEFDVSSRLGEGMPAVENLQHYVWACHRLGYRHPELTQHAAHVRDRYGSEDGMDLFALQADWRALESAVRASQDALQVQQRQASALSVAWQGAGAEASRDFLRRHDEASRTAAALVSTAMEALGAVRETLWRVVDVKVDAVVAIESRAQAQRADWLAAAATVRTGVGDRAVAAELVDQAVKPFVESSVGSDWLAVMRAATTSVTDAYQRAVAEIAAERQPVFDMPGDIGPTWGPAPARVQAKAVLEEDLSAAPSAAAPATTLSSAWSPPPAAVAVPPPPMPPAAAESLAPARVPAGPTLPPELPLPGMGSGPEFGGGLSGFGQQLADSLSGLLGGTGGFVPEIPEMDFPDLDDPPDLEEAEEAEEADDPDDADDADDPDDADDAEEADADDEEADADDEEATDGEAGDGELGEFEATADSVSVPPPIPAPPPTPASPPAEPLPPADLPPADPVAARQTPCAIAAGEVPQVGDPPE